MKPKYKPGHFLPPWPKPGTVLIIQAPLPDFPGTLPKLVEIKGRGSGRQGPSPSAPRKKE